MPVLRSKTHCESYRLTYSRYRGYREHHRLPLYQVFSSKKFFGSVNSKRSLREVTGATMDFVVIPYFLALSTLGDNQTAYTANYTYNPPHEYIYTYSVNVDFTKSYERNVQPYYELNVTATLKCTPKSDVVLSCVLENGRTNVLYPNRNSRFESIQSGKEFFEINYIEAGVENLHVSSPLSSETSDKKYGLVKIVASQLNIGTYFGSRKTLRFTAKETSTFGECETRFIVSPFECKRKVNKIPKNFQFRTIFFDTIGESILVRKERVAKRCERSSHVSLIENSESAEPTATSSYSEMRFCPDSIESSTVFEGKTVALNDAGGASIFRQTVKVRLESFEETKKDLGSFPNDNTIETIYLHKEVDDNDLDTR